MTRVVLADDEEFVRYFLKTVMDTLKYEVVAEVEKGDDLPRVLDNTKPDILFLDINMPKLTGIEFLQQYADKYSKTCIIILTSTSLMRLVGEPAMAKAKCFLRKDTPIDDMIVAIEEAWLDFKKENL